MQRHVAVRLRTVTRARNDGEDFLSNPSVDYVATFLYKDGFMTSGAIMTGFVLANPSGTPIKIPLPIYNKEWDLICF